MSRRNLIDLVVSCNGLFIGVILLVKAGKMETTILNFTVKKGLDLGAL